MVYQKFMPEGWDTSIEPMSETIIQDARNNGIILQGLVNKCDETGNLYLNLGKGIKGIVPLEEVEAVKVNNKGIPKKEICFNKVNKIIQFKVLGKDEKTNQYILSRKSVGKEATKWMLEELKEGQTVNGIVRNITDYGAFIEIGGGIVGLAYIEDLSVARIKSPEERLKIGQKLKVVIKSINREDKKISLSYKEVLGTWEENASKFTQGEIVEGIIRETEKENRGIFIEITPNLIGMAEYKSGYEYGQKVSVYIKKILPQKKKIKLVII